MMTKEVKVAVFLLMASAAAGCVSGPSSGYVNPDDDVYGKPFKMDYTQKSRSIGDVLGKMKTDPMFSTQYAAATNRAHTAGRVLPTIAVRPIENNTGDGRSDSAVTGQMYRELITELRKTKLFEMIDYTRRKTLIDTVTGGANSGDDPAAIQHIGNYTSADFIMTGELRRERTDDRRRTVYHHFLNLEMTDTSTGTVFWSDTATPVVKFEAR